MTIVIGARGVQCQRTRFYIPEPTDGQTYICERCPHHETYRRLDAGDTAEVLVTAATSVCRKEFGVDDDGLPTVVWLGEHPETVFEQGLGVYHVYLSRGADPQQTMYSGAHEAFHRVCTPDNSRHWAHEMLAVHFSLRYLDLIGQSAHAEKNRRSLSQQAHQCSLEQFLVVDRVPYPDGTYGRAYVVGEALTAAVGWDLLKPLALTRNADGRPCVETWLRALPQADRVEALAVLAV